MDIKQILRNTLNYRLNWIGWMLIIFVSAQMVIDFGVLWGLATIVGTIFVFWVGAINQELEKIQKIEIKIDLVTEDEEDGHDW